MNFFFLYPIVIIHLSMCHHENDFPHPLIFYSTTVIIYNLLYIWVSSYKNSVNFYKRYSHYTLGMYTKYVEYSDCRRIIWLCNVWNIGENCIQLLSSLNKVRDQVLTAIKMRFWTSFPLLSKRVIFKVNIHVAILNVQQKSVVRNIRVHDSADHPFLFLRYV